MARVRKGSIVGTTEILRHKDFTAIPVMLSDEGVEADAFGRKVVPAGTILGGGALEGGDVAVVDNTETAEGVLRYDVDLTHGEREVSMIIRGEVYEDKLPEELGEGVKEALASRILFIK